MRGLEKMNGKVEERKKSGRAARCTARCGELRGTRGARRSGIEAEHADGVLAQDLRLLEDNGEPIPDPPLRGHALIGDLNLARDLRGTSLSDGKRQQVWRLLAQEPTGWLFLIRTLPSTAAANERPTVLAIPNAKQGQVLILSPESPEVSP
jgi:hypothetical protein